MKPPNDQRRIAASGIIVLLFLGMLIFASGLGVSNSGSPVPITKITHMAHPPIDTVALKNGINPANGFQLPVIYASIGPKLIESGTIDLARLQLDYQRNGRTLSNQEVEILTRGSQEPIIISQENKDFLFRVFWAMGLTNQNTILDSESMHANGLQLEDMSSLSAWKLSQKPAVELFSSGNIVSLSPDQQSRVKEVARAVYLPCCDHPALFADCSHGMAMLGLLELMGSQGASTEAMFTAAKQVSAFWFPQQTLEKAIFMIATQLKDYPDADPQIIVGSDYSSAKGFQQIDLWLAKNGMLKDENKPLPVCTE